MTDTGGIVPQYLFTLVRVIVNRFCTVYSQGILIGKSVESKGNLMRFGIKHMAVIAASTLIAPAAFAGSHGGPGDAEAGAKVFKSCKACHQVGEGAKNRSGPVLNDVIGRTAGTAEGFKYGKSMIAAGEAGLVWDAEKIADFIENPSSYLKEVLDSGSAKSKMGKKVKKEDDRADVAAYLATFSEAPAE
jgi:cytochrome c2